MGKGIENLDIAYTIVLIAALFVLAILLLFALIRAIKGPKVTDRIVAANMIGTIVIVIIGIFSVLLGEGYLMDICIVYAMLSFLAVIILTKVYAGVYKESRSKRSDFTLNQLENLGESKNDRRKK